jgi:cytoskeletal protein CcmA (bactofilin family)
MLRFVKSSRSDDSGSALIAVISLAAVTAVIAITVGVATVNSLQFTNSTAGSVEARAAADAGVVVAELALRAEGCDAENGVFESSGNPAYRVTTSYDAGAGWVEGCPPAEATQVRFVSEGFAQRPIFGAGSSVADVTVEAVYQYIPEYVSIPSVDPAIYAYSIEGEIKNFVLDSAENVAADIQIKEGNLLCQNAARIAGDVILANGFASLTNCNVSGTVYASQHVHVSGNGTRVQGDVIAAGGNPATGTRDANTARIASGAIVNGSVFAGGNTRILASSGARVDGNVTAARNTSTVLEVANNAEVRGNVLSSGTLDIKGTVNGTRSSAVTSLQLPPAPEVPNWVDIPYTSFAGSTWQSEGYTEVLWSGPCVVDGSHPFWPTLSTRTSRTVVNALSCGASGIELRNNIGSPLSLQTDIAIIANQFKLDKFRAEPNPSTAQRKIYMIVPDNVVSATNPRPDCGAGQGNILLTSESDFHPGISGFIYTPCKIQSDRDGFRGQFYGGQVEFNQQAKLTFVPTSPPGIDLSGGTTNEQVLVGAYLGDRISIRELSSGG